MLIKRKPVKKGEIRRVIDKDLDNVFADFSNTLNNTNFNLDIFFKNIKDVELEEITEEKLAYKSSLSEYDTRRNKIHYLKDEFKTGIMHELFHLATRVMTDSRIYLGFCQIDLDNDEWIGLGINEGYTAILDDRYFPDYVPGKKDYLDKSYYMVKHFVKKVENVLGQDSMEKLYSESNLYELTKYLADMTDFKSTLKFYRALDYMTLIYNEKIKYNPREFIRMINYCVRYTARLYFFAYEYLHNVGSISDKDYKDFLMEFRGQLATPILISDRRVRKNKVVNIREFKQMHTEVKEKIRKYA